MTDETPTAPVVIDPYSPVPITRMPDGTIWLEFPHLAREIQWRRMAGWTPPGHVLLPCLAFGVEEYLVDDEVARGRSIVFRRRNARVYVSTEYLVALFPGDRDRLDHVTEVVRRAVSLSLARGVG
jgi:hypothetical protein